VAHGLSAPRRASVDAAVRPAACAALSRDPHTTDCPASGRSGSSTTPGGDVRVKAEAQIERTRREIDALLVDYAEQARELMYLAVEHA